MERSKASLTRPSRFLVPLVARSKFCSSGSFANGWVCPVQLVTSKAALWQLNASLMVAGSLTSRWRLFSAPSSGLTLGRLAAGWAGSWPWPSPRRPRVGAPFPLVLPLSTRVSELAVCFCRSKVMLSGGTLASSSGSSSPAPGLESVTHPIGLATAPSRHTWTLSGLPSGRKLVSMMRTSVSFGISPALPASASLPVRSTRRRVERRSGKPTAASRRFSSSLLLMPVIHPSAVLSPSSCEHRRSTPKRRGTPVSGHERSRGRARGRADGPTGARRGGAPRQACDAPPSSSRGPCG